MAIAKDTLELADGQGPIQLLQKDWVSHMTGRFEFSKPTALPYVKTFSPGSAVFVDKSHYQKTRLVFNPERVRTQTGEVLRPPNTR